MRPTRLKTPSNWLLAFGLGLTALASHATDCTVVTQILLKNPKLYDEPLDNLGGVLPVIEDAFPPVNKTFSDSQRYTALRDFPLAQVVAAPGHKVLRKPEQIKGLRQYIESSHGGDFISDKVLLNVITHADGRVKEVDLWNAHHRVVAYLDAGYKTLGDIPEKNIQILVNGHTSRQEMWGHYLPGASLNLKKIEGKYSTVPAQGDVTPGTVSVDGRLSNHELGSRANLEQIHKNTLKLPPKKVGVFFGTFDPVHEGHVEIAQLAKHELGLDEVLFIPNDNPLHEPDATSLEQRVQMLSARLDHEKGMNVYVAPSAKIIDRFGKEAFLLQLEQEYGTKNLYQILGQDSYEKLRDLHQISPQAKHKYYVTGRGKDGKPLHVPSALHGVVVTAKGHPQKDVSSSDVRKAIRKGETPGAEDMHPNVTQYIQARGLYK
ncbi:MAG: nicotinate-nicotinamide nucleotide adenylyltransferase [Bdellovibrionales bacterium]|nr:nicotinate-nicotinamide nucleotide adenylyltransferase [Bdellovibrionales bacterium]